MEITKCVRGSVDPKEGGNPTDVDWAAKHPPAISKVASKNKSRAGLPKKKAFAKARQGPRKVSDFRAAYAGGMSRRSSWSGLPDPTVKLSRSRIGGSKTPQLQRQCICGVATEEVAAMVKLSWPMVWTGFGWVESCSLAFLSRTLSVACVCLVSAV